MAIAVVHATRITGANSGTIPATTGGNTLFVAYAGSSGAGGGGGTPSVSGITLGGSADNFAAQKTQNQGTQSASVSTIWMDPNCAGGATTVAVSGTNLVAADAYILAVEVSGLGSAPAMDKSNSGPLGAGTTTWTSNATGTLTTAAEFAIGVTAHGPNSTTDTLTGPGTGGWTNAAGFTWASGSAIGGYQVTAATTSLTYSGTSVDFDFYTCVIATFAPGGGTAHSGAAALDGTGTLAGAGVFAGAAALSGTGTLGGTGTVALTRGQGIAALSGSGTLGGTGTGVFTQAAALSGTGTLAAAWTATLAHAAATLEGLGSLQLSGVRLGFTAGLSGNGTLSVLQATGGLVFASPGAAVPYAYPLSSQVMIAPPGTQAWVPLGSVGVVTALTYSFTCPGGADAMTATVMLPAAYRTQLFNPGWQVKITRGGHTCWTGKLDEPQPSASGWTLTASGTGNRGQDYLAIYSGTWPSGQPDSSINAAIARGLPWQNPGVGTPAGAWFGQAVDSGAQTIAGLLNLICTRGGLTWMVSSQPGGVPGDDLSVFPLPAVPNRLLISVSPVPRTLGGDINTIYLRYQSSADDPGGTGAAASFATTSVTNAASVTAHQELETFIDISDAGTMTAAAAQAVGNSVLSIYQRASFAGPFTARYGQLTTTGGVPVDPGTDQAGTMVRLILTDFGYGGEVTPQFPVTFIVGSYEWDDLAQTATITPYQNVDQSLTGLLSLANTELTPVTVASA